uniref:Putative DNA binding, helix-turn-helix domain containing protein n=1 Tax=viral metagenome TaxID=1070528 RepID=A0A6H2A1T1_9ZZZZ
MTALEIKAIRAEQTVAQFAAALGVHRLTVYRWEDGSRQPKGLYKKALQRLAKKRGIALSD